MADGAASAVIAGLICLDIIPAFPAGNYQEMFRPGAQVEVGDAVLSTGGAISNTGLALQRLGHRVALVGKVGDDVFGDAVIRLLNRHASGLADGMRVTSGSATSYSVVVNPPGFDRMFLHSPGANNTFSAEDVPDSVLRGARLLHFGYPPLMETMRRDNGNELKSLFRRARELGLATSLDMAMPDPNGSSGAVDWRRYLENVLPEVDIFLPSLDELIMLLYPDRKSSDSGGTGIDDIRRVAEDMLALGPAMVGLKLGEQGFYLRTSAAAGRHARMGRLTPADSRPWLDVELVAPCRQVTVAGTTGAGDCAVAGFLGALLEGLAPDAAVATAVAAGAAAVERLDAWSGVPHRSILWERIRAGWPELPSRAVPAGWRCLASGTRCRP